MIGERIKKVRKALDLTQQEFADSIGSKRNTIATYEMGRTSPSAAVFSLICQKFNVSEQWLRTGEGEMFNQLAPADELSNAVHSLLSGESSDFKTRLIKILAGLGQREWEILESYALKLVQEKPPEPEDEEQSAKADIEAKLANYRKELEAEYRAKGKLSASADSEEEKDGKIRA